MSNDYAGLFSSRNEQIPLVSVKVVSDIVGAGARTRIIQEFRNLSNKPIEAVYKFPTPENAAICGFKATVGDKIIRGEIEERDKAFEAYDDALMEGHGAFLLDNARPNILTLSVGSLKPNTTVIIEVEYVNTLSAHGNELRYFLPTTISPRYIPTNLEDRDGIPEDNLINPPLALEVPYRMQLTVNIHNKDGIESFDSPSHRIVTAIATDSFVVSLSGELTEMDRDFVLNITLTQKNEFGPTAYTCEVAGERFYQVDFVTERITVETDENSGVTQEIIFLLDCSGSMQGSSIEEAKRAIAILLRAICEGTPFNIYRFGTTFEKLFDKSERYSAKQAEQAIAYTSKIEADLGGTEIYAPLLDIYKSPAESSRCIVILTDGEVGNETEVCGLVARGAEGTRVFTVGIGHGPNEYFIRQLARSSDGASELIAPNERIEPKVLRLFKKVISKPTKTRINWDSDVEQCPKAPVVYGGELVNIFGRITSDKASSMMKNLNMESEDGKKSWQLPIVTVHEHVNPIPQLWARAMIAELEESAEGVALTGSKQTERKQDAIKERIIAISKQYGIMSAQTSFIGIEIRVTHEKITDEVVLRRIPLMLTKDWGGQGVLYDSTPRVAFLASISKYEPSISVSKKKARSGMNPKTGVSYDKVERSRDAFICDFENMYVLLNAQRTEGGFEITSSLSTVEHWDLKEIKELAKIITHKDKTNTFILLCTAIVLAVLDMQFQDRRDEWESVVSKSVFWLKKELQRTQATIEGISLDEWTKDYVKSKRIEKNWLGRP